VPQFKLQPGVNICSNAEYHGDLSYVSSSGYKKLLESPALFYEENILGKRKAQEEQPHLQFGSLLHTMVLEPHLVEQEYAVFEGLRRAGAAFETFAAANAGKIIITRAKMEEAKWLVKGIHKSKGAQSLLSMGGQSEHTVAVDLNGIPTKARADKIIVQDGIIWDLKTTSWDLDPDSVRMTIKHWSYDLSAALYCEVFAAHYGRPFDFYWMFTGKKDADCAVYKMSEDTRQGGLQQIAKAARIYKQCKATQIWEAPGKILQLNEDIREI
jgi:hypothetical protein